MNLTVVARFRLTAFAEILLCAVMSNGANATDYQMPYSANFKHPLNELIGDIIDGIRGDPKGQSSFAFENWNSKEVRAKYGAWGPPAKTYPVPGEIEKKSAEWKRERVIATALHFQGITYQHHHIPGWDPPADWPWKAVGAGHNAPGVDCSNFTSFVYNLALGIKLNSDVEIQAGLTEAKRADGTTVKLQRIEKPASYAEFKNVLRPGDLIFVRNHQDQISHVIMWVGSPNSTVSLAIDSTGTGHRDSNGKEIPDGVYLRPFEAKSWYYKSAAHVLRVILDD